jgi:succinate dehydrogenase / fumarate reductase flavoprotein subunit
VDIVKDPILVYPTLHYQNGGVSLKADGATSIPNLYGAGEISGGVHGRNRLMGNSLLEVTVYGRRAGRAAGQRSKAVSLGKLTLAHVAQWEKSLSEAGVETEVESPLVLPDYTRHGR